MADSFFLRHKALLENALYRYRDDIFELKEYARIQAPVIRYGGTSRHASGKFSDSTANKAIQNIEPPESIKHKQKWVNAISDGMAIIKKTSPEKAELIDRFYGLSNVIRYQNQPRKMMLVLCADLNISEPTAYRWRTDALQELMVHAIYYGVILPA